MALSEVLEIDKIVDMGFAGVRPADKVNELLASEDEQWMLLSVTVLPDAFWVDDRKHPDGGYVEQSTKTTYVLGRTG